MDQGIIFCRTKLDCDNLEKYLSSRSGDGGDQFSATCLHSDRGAQQRKANLEKFKVRKNLFDWFSRLNVKKKLAKIWCISSWL